MPFDVASCHVMSCQVVSRDLMLCHVLSCPIGLSSRVPRDSLACVVDKSRGQESQPEALTRDVLGWFVVSRPLRVVDKSRVSLFVRLASLRTGRVTSCHIVSCHIMLCHVMTCHACILVGKSH